MFGDLFSFFFFAFICVLKILIYINFKLKTLMFPWSEFSVPWSGDLVWYDAQKRHVQRTGASCEWSLFSSCQRCGWCLFCLGPISRGSSERLWPSPPPSFCNVIYFTVQWPPGWRRGTDHVMTRSGDRNPGHRFHVTRVLTVNEHVKIYFALCTISGNYLSIH